MQLEHNSIIYNHQQSPPMYINTNPHRSQHLTNFTNAQIHKVTYSIMTQSIQISQLDMHGHTSKDSTMQNHLICI